MFPLFFVMICVSFVCLYHREVLFANCFCFVSELLKCEMIEKNDCTDTPKQQIRIKDHISFSLSTTAQIPSASAE